MIAEFKVELTDAFEELLLPGCGKRILFFHGESGIGKTTLLKHCLGSLPDSFPCVEIQIRNSEITINDFLDRLGWEFQRYRAEAGMLQGHKVEIEKVSISGNNNSVTASISSSLPIGAEKRDLNIMLENIERAGRIALVVFDTYELASSKFRNWIEETFLPRVAKISCVRVIIAGRVVPETHNIFKWPRHCSIHHLEGIKEVEHWLPVMRFLNKHVPQPNDEFHFLSLLCSSLQGKPHLIMQVIEGLPPREGSQ